MIFFIDSTNTQYLGLYLINILHMLCPRTSCFSHSNDECLVINSCRSWVWRVICTHMWLYPGSDVVISKTHGLKLWSVQRGRIVLGIYLPHLGKYTASLLSHIRLHVRNVWFRDNFCSEWLIFLSSLLNFGNTLSWLTVRHYVCDSE